MDTIAFIVGFVLHVEQHLTSFALDYGAWIYGLLFLIVFVETGLVVMPFLPGDSLLFVVGTLCGAGVLDLASAVVLMAGAAIAGDQTNYAIGRRVGARVYGWQQSRLFNRRAFDRTHALYERHGGIIIVLARFLPFVRTFAPFVAGVALMDRTQFTAYNVAGAVLWVVGITVAGYLFGNIAWVQANLNKIIWGLVLVPGVIALLGAWRGRRSAAARRSLTQLVLRSSYEVTPSLADPDPITAASQQAPITGPAATCSADTNADSDGRGRPFPALTVQ